MAYRIQKDKIRETRGYIETQKILIGESKTVTMKTSTFFDSMDIITFLLDIIEDLDRGEKVSEDLECRNCKYFHTDVFLSGAGICEKNVGNHLLIPNAVEEDFWCKYGEEKQIESE